MKAVCLFIINSIVAEFPFPLRDTVIYWKALEPSYESHDWKAHKLSGKMKYYEIETGEVVTVLEF